MYMKLTKMLFASPSFSMSFMITTTKYALLEMTLDFLYPIIDFSEEVVCHVFLPYFQKHNIHLIHKYGDNSNPNNYRVIIIGHNFS